MEKMRYYVETCNQNNSSAQTFLMISTAANPLRPFVILFPALILSVMAVSCDAVDGDRELPISDREKLARFENPDFVKANPDYFEAWQLALWRDGDLMANPETAVMFLEHRNVIRNQFSQDLPEVREHFSMPWEPGNLILGADIRHMEDVRDGFFRPFNQLGVGLVPDSIAFLDHLEGSEHFFFMAYFDILMNVEQLAGTYRQLPEVLFTDPNHLGTWGGTPFPVYPGHIDGDWYYLFYKNTYVTERTSLFKVEPRGLQGYSAELVESFVAGEQPSSNTRNIIQQIHQDFRDRVYDQASVERIDEIRVSLPE